ncbi:hypothetical protein IFR05_014342 [Cadophora sp. M221]|nr:hypothetical protein IFR05_014342 [Cadophora sp. M221]
MSVPATSFVTQSDAAPLARHREATATSEHPRTSPSNTGVSEGLDSRWAALQHNSAPFPPLMLNPAVWSGEPAITSPEGDPTAQFALGMTRYQAKVDLHSEPVSEDIVKEPVARVLFTLFLQKCHPLFPLLNPPKDQDSYFGHIRSSSPFLFTVMLSIAGRYYNGYREMEPGQSSLPPITAGALEALADLACSHLGFVLFRKQHQLSDVQATLLLSVWIPRGNGQSADQWMVTGLCSRLAYRIGVPDSSCHPAITRLLNSTHLDANDIREAKDILPQWHAWLIINQYDTSLSLGFGRPHQVPFAHASPRDYLTIARKLVFSTQVDLTAATYVSSLAELSSIATSLISGLRNARLPPTPGHDAARCAGTAWSNISALLSDLNPRLDEWHRQWTWSGSFDTIALANADGETRENQVVVSYLARACEAAVAIVQCYIEPSDTEPIVRYGGDYLVLILGQTAIFFVRLLVARLEQPLPIDQTVLLHYLKKSIELLESNNISSSGICGWVAQLSRGLARYAGLTFDSEADRTETSMTNLDPGLPELDWDFDICALLGQTMPAGQTGLDLGHYFDFSQSFSPLALDTRAHDKTNFGAFSPAR